jgi:hypothetical protein
MASAENGPSCIPGRNWLLVALCCCTLEAAGQGTSGSPEVIDARNRPTPKAWIQRYLGVDFPKSARHFVFYYRSADEDVLLFSFDIDKGSLQHLMNGQSIFPRYRALSTGGSGVRDEIIRDWGSKHFAQQVAVLRNPLSATKARASAAEPQEVQVWAAEGTAGAWQVCVAVTTDKRVDKTVADCGVRMPVVPQEMRSVAVIEGPLERPYDTDIWQRWSLDMADYRKFVQIMRARPDTIRRTDVAARRLADWLDARGPAPGVPWWKPSELTGSSVGGVEPSESFSRKEADMMSLLVIGRVDGLFRCYAYTQCQVLARDPCDAVWRLLRLPLPSSAHNVYHETSSNPAGDVSWVRFDLPWGDVAACLAQTPTLPAYSEFAADVAAQEFLETSYRTDAPQWWHPQELRDGIYTLRRNNTKILADICAGIGWLPGEVNRVYIGAFHAR